MRKTIAAATCLALCTLARAGNPFGYVIGVSPNPASQGDSISIVIASDRVQCFPLPASLGTGEDLGGNVLGFSIPGNDGCESSPPETRSYDVGPKPRGRYTFRFFVCGGNPPPGAPGNGCTVIEEIPVHVRGVAAQTFTVPTLSSRIVLALAFAVMLVAALGSRRAGRGKG